MSLIYMVFAIGCSVASCMAARKVGVYSISISLFLFDDKFIPSGSYLVQKSLVSYIIGFSAYLQVIYQWNIF
jgi:hypothetical protein